MNELVYERTGVGQRCGCRLVYSIYEFDKTIEARVFVVSWRAVIPRVSGRHRTANKWNVRVYSPMHVSFTKYPGSARGPMLTRICFFAPPNIS